MIGKTISHYKIIEKLGAGGMGIVYKAEDTRLNRFVALKFLLFQLSSNEEERRRFLFEAQAAASLDHPNICTVHEIDEVDGKTFIAMAYMDGQSLKDRIETGPLTIEESLHITIQIAEGLKEAHENGIIHRDIKSSNIVFSSRGNIKITDFGLAKMSGRTKITRTGTAVGTVAYMSPEQAHGVEVDHRSDIWSLGVILYEMVSGQLPFRGDYDQAVLYLIINEEPPAILDLRKEVTAELAQVVEKALVKKPEERYQRVEELLSDLRAIRKKSEAGDTTTALEEKAVPSIAVLPFANMSADQEQEYFCDGMAEELINALSKIENLHVPARTSAFAFKGEKLDVREIGRKLNVVTILEGSVRKAGNRLRITAQLINVADGYHLWSERYDRELNDVFAIQDEISMAIVEKLKVRLLHGEKQKLVKRYTDDLEAYSLYLKGRYYWNSLTPEGWKKSYDCYQQAIAMDPNFALAYLGQSIWHQSLGFWGSVHPREAFSKGRELALKTIEIDDSIPDAHNCLGVIYWAYDWNRPEAQRAFQIALESETANSLGSLNYALFLASGKAFDEALLLVKKIQLLDPFSSLINTWAASILSYSGRYDESVSQFQKIIASDPDPWQPYYNLSVALIYQNKCVEAISAAEEAVKRSGGATVAKTFLGCAFALAGQMEKAREQLNDLLERCSEAYVPSTFFVWLYNALQEIEKAFGWLEKGVKDHDPWLLFYGIHPRSLHADDPRFDSLLRTNGIVV